jgi:hypothetical protein
VDTTAESRKVVESLLLANSTWMAAVNAVAALPLRFCLYFLRFCFLLLVKSLKVGVTDISLLLQVVGPLQPLLGVSQLRVWQDGYEVGQIQLALRGEHPFANRWF